MDNCQELTFKGINSIKYLKNVKTISLKDVPISLDNLSISKSVTTIHLNKIEMFLEAKEDLSKNIWKNFIKPNLIHCFSQTIKVFLIFYNQNA